MASTASRPPSPSQTDGNFRPRVQRPQHAPRWDCTLLAGQPSVQCQGLAHSRAKRAILCGGHGEPTIYIVGCHIPPTVLSTLPQVEQALKELPTGRTPLLIGDLNGNLHTPRDKRDEWIAEVVEDVCGLTDLSKHFRQQSCGHTLGRWTLRMRRGGKRKR